MKARVERAAWAAQRGATLTSQLLSFARKQPLASAPVDLAATMPDLVPLLRLTLGEAVDVRYVEAAGLWPAMANPAQLGAAVLKLALNARNARPGGGRLTIELAKRVLDAKDGDQDLGPLRPSEGSAGGSNLRPSQRADVPAAHRRHSFGTEQAEHNAGARAIFPGRLHLP